MREENLSDFVVRKAESIYETQLQRILESNHDQEFVAIEPESGDFFLGRTLDEAAKSARETMYYPNRLTHT